MTPMTTKIAGGPSIDLCSFGLSSASSAYSTSYSDRALQEAGTINGMYGYDVFTLCNDGPNIMIMIPMVVYSASINEDLNSGTEALSPPSSSVSASFIPDQLLGHYKHYVNSPGMLCSTYHYVNKK